MQTDDNQPGTSQAHTTASSDQNGQQLGAVLQEQLRQLFCVVQDIIKQRRQAEADAAAGGSLKGVDIPDEFLDPITATLMEDPVLLPASRVVVDRTTITRHIMSSSTDPFSRSPLTLKEVVSETELRQRIMDWKQRVQAHRGAAGALGISAFMQQ
eukprot:jgi/Chrzof1/11335/Cz05g32260.t1